ICGCTQPGGLLPSPVPLARHTGTRLSHVSHHPALLNQPSGVRPFPNEQRDWVWLLQPYNK
ncbi:MAG: hypothetical protein KBG64_00445, partial [Clostridia bacterium]|nr:hypothetical protein [Clostridia bacterium]